MSVESLPSYSDNNSQNEIENEKRCYGWKMPTGKTDNDLKLINKTFFKNPSLINFPPQLELTDMPPVYNQGNIGSCTANAISNLYRYGKQSRKKKSLNNSPLVDYSYITTNEV